MDSDTSIDIEVEELEAELYQRALNGDEIAELFLRKGNQWPTS